MAIPGCSAFIDSQVPEPIRRMREPDLGNEYLLYRPSNYKNDATWPLIVVCHGGFGGSPDARIREWSPLAERFGFVVAAPTLNKPRRGSSGAAAAEPSWALQDHEATVLSTVRHVQAGQNISEDRILIHGASDGAAAALFAGLHHPDVFRAIAVSQPRVAAEVLPEMLRRVDPYQPVFAHYDESDWITGKNAVSSIQALRKAGVSVTEDRSGSLRESDAPLVIEFFLHVLRSNPWIRIRALAGPSGDPLEVQWKVRCSVRARKVEWDFGDQQKAFELEAVHRFAKPGDYNVSLTLVDDTGREHRRSVRLTVPEGVAVPVPGAAAPPP